MTNTLKKNAVMILAAALAAVLLLAVVFAPVSLADNSTADSSVASAVEKTHATVSAKLGEIKATVGEDVDKLENLWNYGDKVEAGVESATDDFVGMLEDIGRAYDKGDVEGILKTPKTFVDGLKGYLGSIAGSVKP